MNPGEVETAQQDLGDVGHNTRRLISLLRPAKRGSLVVRSVSPHLYSCAGMIFANRRTWLDIDDILHILREDGYSRLRDDQSLSIGDIALYAMAGRPSHVGLVTQLHRSKGGILNVRLLSKWGRGGEIEHDVRDVPDFCGTLESYWSERVPPDV